GETGSGKTTLARATVGLVAPATGTIEFEGRDLGALRGRELREFRRQGQVQLVFQDPLRSLDPDLTINRLVAEPLDIAGGLSSREKAARIDEALREVGLEPESIRGRRPRQLSGGQRQRVSLARAIVTRPALLFCDEPVSALDVSVQASILNLLKDLQDEFKLTYLFIAHDLAVVRHMSDEILVMNGGRVVEAGPAEEVCGQPRHDYTRRLLASIPALG
ncbi:MAG TPA: hypothetical protein DIT64_16630, partial [Verrucomicrobiales bacterium]|nr:hypothetical protein [Verrucomicrobiales bacterium]